MLNLDIDFSNKTQQWIGNQVEARGFASPSAYLGHLVEQDRQKKTTSDDYYKPLFDYVGVKNREEFFALAKTQAQTLSGDQHEIEVMNFLESLDDENK